MKTYNFIEAVNSGKWFRNTGEFTWLKHNGSDSVIDRYGNTMNFSSVNYMLGEFIVEVKSITITESELDEICDKIENVCYVKGNEDLKYHMKKELGF